MEITSHSIRAGLIPPAALRDFVQPYGLMDHDEFRFQSLEVGIAAKVRAATSYLLRPAPGSPAAILMAAIRQKMMAIPIETALGASLTSVKMTRSPADETRRAKTNATFTYNDGLAVTRWVDWGDHGLTLLSMDGTPAFYTVMTSDAYFDSRAAAKKAGVSFAIVDRLEELPEHHLDELVGDIDVRRLAALPRRRLEETHSASERFSLSQLYAAPPSPVGRARLGRRA